MQEYINPTEGRVSEIVKLIVSVVYVLIPLALLIYREYQGETLEPIMLFMLLLFIFASAYVIFGKKIIEQATEKAESVTDGGKKNDGE